ncbi:MAG: hypothetical protein ACHQQQ_14140 [Bacteroidota bacterium]
MKRSLILLVVLGLFIAANADAQSKKDVKRGQSSPANKVQLNRDAIIADLTKLGADAYQYKIRPTDMGGGNKVYDGSTGAAPYTLKTDGPWAQWGPGNPNATFSITEKTASSITLQGSSKIFKGSTVAIAFDSLGKAGKPVYTGKF